MKSDYADHYFSTTVFTYRSTQSSFSIASTYSPSRVSSACSCILTAAPSPTTIYTITKTLPATPTCTPPVIVQNGNFENGQNISPWVVNDYPGDAQHETYGVVSPGYGGSQYAYEASDDLPLGAYPAFDLRLNQTLKLCKDQRYNISARYYISDEPDGYNGAIYLQIVTPRPGKREGDTQVVASATTGDVYGNGTAVPPGAWKTLEGSFLANLDEVTLVVDFSSHSYSNRQFGLDDVVVFPA